MWNATSQHLDDRTIKAAITRYGEPVPYANVLQRWQTDAMFRSFFISLLADSPFSAFRWETPPITKTLANRPFEFVLLNSPSLARRVDTEAFADHFNGESEGVVTFPNLGRDAILVVPCPSGPLSAYGHIGAFIRQASKTQIHALWSLVGEAMERRLSTKPVWLSTAGGGIPWLHVRLDDRPKYYGYAPYQEGSYL